MGRPQSTAGGRPYVVSGRFSAAEVADMDRRRGPLSRAEWLRYLALQARKQDISLGMTRDDEAFS